MAQAVNAREVPGDLIAPDFLIENVRTGVTDDVYLGAAGARKWLDDFFGVLDEQARFELDELIDAGGDSVVMVHHLAGYGRASGAPFRMRWASAVWIHDEKITRIVGYATRHEALEAAGLPGQPAPPTRSSR
jgi:ketosteroid isomerase-like protein